MGKIVPRRTIKELLFVLARLRCTHLIVVEGYSDRSFFRWLLDWTQSSHFSIHAVDEIDVPVTWLTTAADYSNNRQIVAAVALGLSAREDAQLRVLGVVDADCGTPIEWSTDCIVKTDFPSIESYCFTPETLHKLLVLTLGLGDNIDGVALRDELAPVLAGLFAVRSRTGSLGGAVDKVLAYEAATWNAHFRADPAHTEERRRIYQSARIGADPRETCYGHDLAAVLMLRFVARIKNHVGVRSVAGLERTLVAHLERAIAEESALGHTIRRWIAEDAA